MLTARAGCYWHPQHRQTLTRTFTLRLQNRGPGDEAALPHSEYQRHLSPSLSPLRPRANPRGPILSRCEMCNSQGWLPSAPGREQSRPKGLGPSGRQGWLEGSPGKARGCGQEGCPQMSSCFIQKSREQFWKKRQVQEAAPGPGCPHEGPRTWLHFPWNQAQITQLPKACLSLDTTAFLPQVGRQQINCPDDSIEGSWGAGGRGLLPDVASAGLLPNPGDPLAPHFTLLEAGD